MDYRKAWDEIKTGLEGILGDMRDTGADKPVDDMRVYGMYEAYKNVLHDMTALESKIVSQEIEVGDTVRVIEPGLTYPCYSEWIRDNIDNPFLAAKWGRDRRLNPDATGVVRRIAPHGKFNRTLAYVEVGNVCFIIALEALEKI